MIDLWVVILILVIFILGYIKTVLNIPWSCIFGKHKYVYAYEKHGMYSQNHGKEVIGTRRKIYQCACCGKEKPAEEKDWIQK